MSDITVAGLQVPGFQLADVRYNCDRLCQGARYQVSDIIVTGPTTDDLHLIGAQVQTSGVVPLPSAPS